VAAEEMSDERRSLGWVAPDLGSCRVVLHPSNLQIENLIADNSQETVQVIAGARGTALGDMVAKMCVARNVPFGIITEAPDGRGFLGVLRQVKYTAERIRIDQYVSFVLAMGEIGERWFARSGYKPERLYPYCYVTEKLVEPPQPAVRNSLVFVGRLVALKGVDILIDALAKVPFASLTIVGDGPELAALKRRAINCGADQRIEWIGNVPAASVAQYIAPARALVLPSRKDGWGAVVNEALIIGTPVICSSACGASDLVRRNFLGTVFQSGDANDLSRAIAQVLNNTDADEEARGAIQDWASAISASSVATYFEQVIEHSRGGGGIKPTAPWRV
jgi:glycosyltransferase involved in cell wall biosynthesis